MGSNMCNAVEDVMDRTVVLGLACLAVARVYQRAFRFVGVLMIATRFADGHGNVVQTLMNQ